jgi:hypothetical protein
MLELGRAAQEQGFDVDILATDPYFRDLIQSHELGLVELDDPEEIRPFWDLRGLVQLPRFLSRSPTRSSTPIRRSPESSVRSQPGARRSRRSCTPSTSSVPRTGKVVTAATSAWNASQPLV